jgi:hypothetical protein
MTEMLDFKLETEIGHKVAGATLNHRPTEYRSVATTPISIENSLSAEIGQWPVL